MVSEEDTCSDEAFLTDISPIRSSVVHTHFAHRSPTRALNGLLEPYRVIKLANVLTGDGDLARHLLALSVTHVCVAIYLSFAATCFPSWNPRNPLCVNPAMAEEKSLLAQEIELLPPTLQNVLDQTSLKWIFCGS